MLRISKEKRLRRETLATDRTRPIIVELFPFYCGVRVFGTREFYAVPWDAILDLGRKLDAREKLAAKRGA
jgi:hypothetical protein